MTKFSSWDYSNYYHTIIENPYIDFELYDKQELGALTSCHKQDGINEMLTGGAGGGGKTKLLSALALQFIEFSQYRCLVTRKKYRELVGTGSVFDMLKNIDGLKPRESGLIRILAPSGAEIHFKAFDNETHKQDVKGESYHTILNDEASELNESTLRFLYRSLRKKADDWIPLRFINASNPGGDSTDYLVEKYIDGNLPYIDMCYRDNPYIDTATYEESLKQLDYIDQQYQMYGNWKYRASAGDLIDLATLQKAYIDVEDYISRPIQFCTEGMDLASTGRDFTVIYNLILLNNGVTVVNDIMRNQTKTPEAEVERFVEKNAKESQLYTLGIELEPGSDSTYSMRYWRDDILRNIQQTYGIIIKGIRPVKNKFNRARPVAQAIRNGKLLFSRHLQDILEAPNGLFDQFMTITPDAELMKKQKSPDDVDALGYAWQEMSPFTV